MADLRPVDREDPVAMLASGAGTQPLRSDAASHELTVDLLEICAEPRPRRGRAAKRDQTPALGMRKLPQGARGVAAVQDSADLSAAAGAMPAGLRRPAA